MYEILKAKFSQNDDLKQKLIDTGTATLIEGTTNCENYWGSCTCLKCNGTSGENIMGKLLMELRDSFK